MTDLDEFIKRKFRNICFEKSEENPNLLTYRLVKKNY